MDSPRQPGIERDGAPVILVVHDVEEVRAAIEILLRTEGYRVHSGWNEAEAIEKAIAKPPDLILVSLAGPSQEVIETARRVRSGAGSSLDVHIVIFCVDTIPEGAEVAIAENVYLTRPDNFDQLRALLRRLVAPQA
jgi:CheY-like chemotaxis protein